MTVDQRSQDRVPDIVLLSNALVQNADGSIGCVWAASTCTVGLILISTYLQIVTESSWWHYQVSC